MSITRRELENLLCCLKYKKPFIDLFLTPDSYINAKCCFLRGGKLYDGCTNHILCKPGAQIYAYLEWDGHGNADKIWLNNNDDLQSNLERTPYFRNGKRIDPHFCNQ